MTAPCHADLGIVLLAAGESRRMGQPKQCLPWQGASVVQHACLTLRSALPQSPLIVVLGAFAADVGQELRRLDPALAVRVVIHEQWREGMLSSLQAGLRALPPVEAALFALADQPLVTAEDYGALAVAACSHPDRAIIAAAYADTVGVPAIFRRALFAELNQSSARQEGAKRLIQARRDQTLTVPLPNAASDLDTPSDYARLCAQKNFRRP